MNFEIPKISKGIMAGFAATLVLTVFMLLKNMMGIMPELDPVHMMADMAAQKLGMEPNLVVGWIMHFMIGSVAWGGAFAVFNDIIPVKTQRKKGILLGITAWFMMMIGPMPMGGEGLFGLNIGPMAPVMTFMLHIVYGIVLGTVYTKLNKNKL